jgi:hypothetical protein
MAMVRVGRNSYRKNSAEYALNDFRYSAEESAHSEAFRVPRKSQFRSSERNRTKRNPAKKMQFYGNRTASMITLASNRRPHTCKGCVITATLRKQAKYLSKTISPYLKSRLF